MNEQDAMGRSARPAFGLPGRIEAPNSRPRTLAIVGLGTGGARIARGICAEEAQVDVHVLAKSAAGDPLAAIQAGGGDLQRDLVRADMIFLVACRGDDVSLASVVARIAHGRNHPVTAIYVVPPETQLAEGEDETLRTLRASVEMLVIASDESYVPAMIAALG